MNVSEEFKKFCLNCKHHRIDVTTVNNLNDDGSSSEWEEAKHVCIVLEYPDWIWEDSPSPLPPDNGSIFYKRLKTYYIEEEDCPFNLEYLVSDRKA